MNVTIRPANIRDACFCAANMRDADRSEITAVVALDSMAAIACCLVQGSQDLTFIAYLDGEPVTVFGVASDPLIPHLGSGWAYGTNRMRRTIPEVTRFCLQVLRPLLIDRGLRRLEVRSAVDHDLSHRWLQGMGAKREGIARGYGRNGEDFALYAFTRNPT